MLWGAGAEESRYGNVRGAGAEESRYGNVRGAGAEESRYGDVFISFSSQDREIIRFIREKMKAAGIATWFDEDVPEFPTDDRKLIEKKLLEGILGARHVIVFCSEAALDSFWVRAELGTAIELLRLTGTPSITLVDMDGALHRRRKPLHLTSLLH